MFVCVFLEARGPAFLCLSVGRLCQCDDTKTLKDAVRWVYTCTAEVKMKAELEVGCGVQHFCLVLFI